MQPVPTTEPVNFGWNGQSDAHPLPFVPYRGQLGLFRVPVSTLPTEYAMLWARLEEA